MPYCTIDDLRDQIPEDDLIALTDDADSGLVDTGRVDKAIADADAEIDGYCGKQYSLPLNPVPEIIRKMAVDIALYNLYARRKGAPEDRKERYGNAIRFLGKVAEGKISLGVGDPDTPPADHHQPRVTSSERVFSRDKLEGF